MHGWWDNHPMDQVTQCTILKIAGFKAIYTHMKFCFKFHKCPIIIIGIEEAKYYMDLIDQ